MRTGALEMTPRSHFRSSLAAPLGAVQRFLQRDATWGDKGGRNSECYSKFGSWVWRECDMRSNKSRELHPLPPLHLLVAAHPEFNH
ncbi:hypothetical protein CEXT_361301 [Caerostris extrusa]|uniref:Uncharacterized protein n=1 Tax=Caerostris extrusa TaxID=172846 RepID=A0AAV4XTS9_CAEEX|nr:hypothetical protein CEXT_361301 [Caerostris extrusa]